jgi:hypothetical protein
VWCVGGSNAHLEATLLYPARQSFSEGVDFISDCLFFLRVVGHQNINVGPFTGTHLKGRNHCFILWYIINDNPDFPFPRWLYITIVVQHSFVIIGIGVCVRVAPSGSQQVDFVRLNKIILGWLGCSKVGEDSLEGQWDSETSLGEG